MTCPTAGTKALRVACRGEGSSLHAGTARVKQPWKGGSSQFAPMSSLVRDTSRVALAGNEVPARAVSVEVCVGGQLAKRSAVKCEANIQFHFMLNG